jgi:hypothetical protein
MTPLPLDDPGICDPEALYRRIHPRQVDREGRISSAAFKHREEGPCGTKVLADISVDLGSRTTPEATFRRAAECIGVAEVTAGEARGVEGVAGVVADPLPENDAHALIRKRRDIANKIWERACKRFAELARWVIKTEM